MPKTSYREASKVQILEAPRMPPGRCSICGSSSNDDRDYIDTGWDIDFYGVVYLCTFCMTQVMNELGCLSKEQSEALEAENERLRQHIIDFQAKEMAIHDAADKLRATGLFDFVTPSDGNGANLVVSSGPETLNEFYDRIKQPTNEISGSSEQDNSEQRSDGVSDSDSTTSFNF